MIKIKLNIISRHSFASKQDNFSYICYHTNLLNFSRSNKIKILLMCIYDADSLIFDGNTDQVRRTTDKNKDLLTFKQTEVIFCSCIQHLLNTIISN